MGIDRIGRGAPPVPVQETGGSSPAAPTGQAFQVPKASAPLSSQPVATEGPRGALDRFRAGEIDAQGYVELKVDEATSHLSALPPEKLDAIRTALREQLVDDPALAELVRTAAGEISPPVDD